MIHIAATQYSINTQSMEIYLAGCKANPHCKNCHNPELWDFDYGKEYTSEIRETIIDKIKSFDNIIDGIWILGGEPLDQDIKELEHLIDDFRGLKKKLWLYTRFELDELPEDIKKRVDFIKTGRYVPEEKSDHVEYGVVLASANQHIYKRGKDF